MNIGGNTYSKCPNEVQKLEFLLTNAKFLFTSIFEGLKQQDNGYYRL